MIFHGIGVGLGRRGWGGSMETVSVRGKPEGHFLFDGGSFRDSFIGS